MITNPHMLAKVRSDRIMDECRHMPCSLRIASFVGLQCSGQDTVVGCHLPVQGKGIKTKVTDMAVAAGCFNCHTILDGKVGVELRHRYPAAFVERLLFALVETHARLVMAGVINGPDMEIV